MGQLLAGRTDSELRMAPHPVLRRQDGVDFLRGISILAVMLLHARLRLFSEGRGPDGLLPGWLEDLLFTNGDCGVIVFFAVSGFLITLTSLRRFGSLQAMQAGRFYRIRFARIAPLLLAVLAVLTGLSLGGVDGFVVEPAQGGLLRAIFAVFTFHLNWLEAAHGYLPANWDVLWSLSVEEMFYLFFPLACVGLTRLRWGLLVLLLALVVMGPLARTAWTENILWAAERLFSRNGFDRPGVPDGFSSRLVRGPAENSHNLASYP